MELAKRLEEDLKRVVKNYRGRMTEATETAKTLKKFCAKIDRGFSKLGMMPSVNIDCRGYIGISCKDAGEASRAAAMIVRRTCVTKFKKVMGTWVERGRDDPEWHWEGGSGGTFQVTVRPAMPNPGCKPKIQTTPRADKSWVCEM
jgi:hypothetical protein